MVYILLNILRFLRYIIMTMSWKTEMLYFSCTLWFYSLFASADLLSCSIDWQIDTACLKHQILVSVSFFKNFRWKKILYPVIIQCHWFSARAVFIHWFIGTHQIFNLYYYFLKMTIVIWEIITRLKLYNKMSFLSSVNTETW